MKTFQARVTDEFGGDFPDAIVAIRHFSETSRRTGVSENCQDDYEMETKLDAISYRVNYWYDQEKRAEGRRTRPLINEDQGAFTDLFEVDVNTVHINEILSSSLSVEEKILSAIVSDLTRRFG